jgi:hypothetical protein
MQDNWNAVIAPTMFEGARAICLGTRFRHDDIHATTFNEQNDWTPIILCAIQTEPITGEELAYWPESTVCSYKNLRKLERKEPEQAKLQLEGCSILKFHGKPKPSDVTHPWRHPMHTILRNPLKPSLWSYLDNEIRAYWR